MEPAAPDNKKKIIAGVVVLIAIALLTVGAKALTSKNDIPQNTAQPTATRDTPATTGTTAGNNPSSTGTYKDGTYTATGSYESPAGTEAIDVSVTLQNGTVTDSTVQPKATDRDAREYQNDFVSGYKAFVVGKSIDGIRLSRVSGSSLTSGGFNNALEQIKNKAKA